MVETVKFSQFTDAPLTNDDLETVGLENGVNIRTKKYPTWQTVNRPATPFIPLLGYNTDLQSWEFWEGTQWVQLEDSTDITNLLALFASHVVNEGASLIGLENQGTVTNKTVQDFNEATFIAQTDNGTLPNGQFLADLATGILASTTTTGVVASRVLTGTANQVNISNGNGSGNPTFSLSSTIDAPGTFTIQGSTVIDEIIDDDTMATASATNIPTAESVVAYIGGGGGGPFLPLSGGTMSGDIAMGTNQITGMADPTLAQDAATKAYADLMLPLTGGTMSGAIDMDNNEINNVPLPVLSTDVASKAYVDGIAFNVLPAADYSTTANLAGYVYDNGAAGVGATLTAGGVGAFTTDGQTPAVNSRILVPSQTNGFENGVYDLTVAGDGATAAVLTRATDYDQAAQMHAGDQITVIFGDTLAGHRFMMTQTAAITVGTTDITWRDDTNTTGVVTLTGTANEIDVDNTDPQNPVVSLSSTLVAPGTATVGNILLTGDEIQHLGDIDNKIVFGTDTQSYETGGSSRLDISDTGVRMGAANSRVTTILDEDDMVSDSATALATQQSIKAYVDSLITTQAALYGYIDLTVANGVDADHDISITIGQATDSDDNEMMTLTTGIEKRIDAVWSAGTGNGGFPSALTLSNNTWYHFFLIKNQTTDVVDAGWDTSFTATNLLADATGYTLYRRIASQLTDGSANILPFRQIGNNFYWLSPIADVSGTITTTSANYTLSVPIDVNTIAYCNILASLAANNPSVYLRSIDTVDLAVSTAIGVTPQTTWRHNTSGGTEGGLIEVHCNTNAQFAGRSNVASSDFGVITLGYQDFRGTNNQ